MGQTSNRIQLYDVRSISERDAVISVTAANDRRVQVPGFTPAPRPALSVRPERRDPGSPVRDDGRGSAARGDDEVNEGLGTEVEDTGRDGDAARRTFAQTEPLSYHIITVHELLDAGSPRKVTCSIRSGY